jgi:hypothetical protein
MSKVMTGRVGDAFHLPPALRGIFFEKVSGRGKVEKSQLHRAVLDSKFARVQSIPVLAQLFNASEQLLVEFGYLRNILHFLSKC